MNFFLKRYKEFGHEIDPENISLQKSIRVNTLKTDQMRLKNRLVAEQVILKRIPFTDSGYWFEAEFSAASTPEYLLGHYFIQEAASQIPVIALDPRPNETVLDMCAAPGAKTTQIAQQMENRGRLVALEANLARIDALKNNLERMGVTNCIVYHKDAKYAVDLGVMFDRVMLDAPCSGNFCTDPEWFDKRTLEDIKGKTKEQKALLRAAVAVLKAGGTLVYSTCSMEPEENEEVIEWALENLSVTLTEAGIDHGDPGLTEETALCRRFWPEKHETQGFFIARLVKR